MGVYIAAGLLEEQTIKIFGIHHNPKNFYRQISKPSAISCAAAARTYLWITEV